MSKPLVSVTVPAFNAGKFIGKALDSMLVQTYDNIEIIVVDDGSQDNTRQIVLEYVRRDRRVRLYVHDRNYGEPTARATAYRYCTGEYIARQDADDWSHPERFELMMKRFRKKPTCDIVSCAVARGPEQAMFEIPGPKRFMVPELFMTGDLSHDPISPSTIAKRWVYERVGAAGDPGIPIDGDNDWMAKGLCYGVRWGYVDEVLYNFRVHEGTLSNRLTEAQHYEIKDRRVRKYLNCYKYRWNPFRCMNIMPTGTCNQACGMCGQRWFVEDWDGRNMSLDTVQRVIERIKEINGDYSWGEYSGGEPTLWPHIDAACRMFKESGVFRDGLRTFTNCVNRDKLFQLMDDGLLDEMLTVEYNGRRDVQEEAWIRYQKRVVWNRELRFKRPQVMPYPNALPARCYCDRPCLIGDRMYFCCDAYTTAKSIGRVPDAEPELSCSIEEDWIEFIRKVDPINIEFDGNGGYKYVSPVEQDICQYCIANQKVWDQVPYPEEECK